MASWNSCFSFEGLVSSNLGTQSVFLVLLGMCLGTLPEQKSTIVLLMRKVIVEEGSLGVTNVEVTTR